MFVVFPVISFPLTLLSFNLLLLPVSDADNRGTLRSILILFLPQACIVIDCICSELIVFVFQKQSSGVSSPKPVNASWLGQKKSSDGALSHMLLLSAGHVCWVKTRRAGDILAEQIYLKDNHAFSQCEAFVCC